MVACHVNISSSSSTGPIVQFSKGFSFNLFSSLKKDWVKFLVPHIAKKSWIFFLILMDENGTNYIKLPKVRPRLMKRRPRSRYRLMKRQCSTQMYCEKTILDSFEL